MATCRFYTKTNNWRNIGHILCRVRPVLSEINKTVRMLWQKKKENTEPMSKCAKKLAKRNKFSSPCLLTAVLKVKSFNIRYLHQKYSFLFGLIFDQKMKNVVSVYILSFSKSKLTQNSWGGFTSIWQNTNWRILKVSILTQGTWLLVQLAVVRVVVKRA